MRLLLSAIASYFAGLLVSQLAVADTAAYEIALRPRAVLWRHGYTIGDVAQVSGPNQIEVARLKVMGLGYGPRSSQPVRVSRVFLESLIRERSGSAPLPLHWSGADEITLEARTMDIDGAMYIDAAKASLKRWLANRYAEFDVHSEGDYGVIAVPMGAVKFEGDVGAITRAMARMKVNVDILIDSHKVASVPVWFQVAAFQQALLLNKDIPRCSPIGPTDVSATRADVARELGTVLSDVAQLKAKRTSAPISAGSFVTAERLTAAPDVSKGEDVTVSIQYGAIVVQARAIAQDDGDRGDWIRVLEPTMERNYRVRVTGKNQAVSEGGI
jgi:flagella basal body P-ring formation protein FlgA